MVSAVVDFHSTWLLAAEVAPMLDYSLIPPLSKWELEIFGIVVPEDHYLRNVASVIPWDDFRDVLAPYYCQDKGRPSLLPVVMLKLEYLRYHHNLSDRQVIDRAETDLAFRWFLQYPLQWSLPDPSSLCNFRGRLGRDGFRQIFDQVVSVAREKGVVKDRLRLKDATHVIGDIAVPTALALVAQTRDKLLLAAEPFAALMVDGERINLELLRERTKGLKPEERLAARVAQLRDMLFWMDELTAPANAASNRLWEKFLIQRDLAHKILDDQEHPGRGDRTVSITDPDARCGKHGEWFDGYLLDICVDSDSEIITQINVLAANGDEAADALELIRLEEAAHGNDVQALSIDGAGFNGPVLRELEDPEGLNVATYVPVPEASSSELFPPEAFVEDAEQGKVTCPGGQTSQSCFRDNQKNTTKHRFAAATCRTCPLVGGCMKNPPNRHGRTVCKSDYETEHQRARQKTKTPDYAAVRREHLKVERKLGEIVNRHGGRRARCRGHTKVLIQELMASAATNIKRLVRLLCAPAEAEPCQA
jgi:transposase